MKTLLLSITVFSLTFGITSPQLLGGWTEQSLQANDLYIDRSLKAAMKDIEKGRNYEEEYYLLYPVAVYSQLVNGFNYKVFIAAQKRQTNKVEIFDYVIYTGPFSQKTPSFNITNTNQVKPVNDSNLSNDKLSLMKEALAKYLNKNSDFTFNVSCKYPNAINKISIYTVEAMLLDKNYDFIVVEKSDGSFEVVTQLSMD